MPAYMATKRWQRGLLLSCREAEVHAHIWPHPPLWPRLTDKRATLQQYHMNSRETALPGTLPSDKTRKVDIVGKPTHPAAVQYSNPESPLKGMSTFVSRSWSKGAMVGKRQKQHFLSAIELRDPYTGESDAEDDEDEKAGERDKDGDGTSFAPSIAARTVASVSSAGMRAISALAHLSTSPLSIDPGLFFGWTFVFPKYLWKNSIRFALAETIQVSLGSRFTFQARQGHS